MVSYAGLVKRAKGILPPKAELDARTRGDCLGVAADPEALEVLESAKRRRERPAAEETFIRKPLADAEHFVRVQLQRLRERPRMWTFYRSDFVAEVATMLWMLGVKGSLVIHFHDKDKKMLRNVGEMITEDFAHKVVDEALRILDEHPPPAAQPGNTGA